MSIAKGLLIFFLLIFLFILWDYLCLKWKLKKEREYFINTLNHDLRVSLIAQLRGYEILKNSNYNVEMLKELIEEIYDSCKYSYEMVNMLLNSYKFENSEKVLKLREFNLSELIYSIIIKNNNVIKEKGLKLSYNLSKQVILADREALEKALSILFSIIFFNVKEDGYINICLECVDKKIKFYVKYNGIFLTEEEISRMFSKQSCYSTVGCGIKMQLCKKIIDYHGGNISVKKSESSNLFTIILPAKRKNHNTEKLVGVGALGLNIRCF